MENGDLPAEKGHEEQHMLPRAEFHTSVGDKSGINDQTGVILDLSLSGCQVRVPIMVYPTLVMEMRMYAPELGGPIIVEKAVVQWVNGDRFGLHFLVMQQSELIRLGSVVARLADEVSQ
jgi:hypothetical protein